MITVIEEPKAEPVSVDELKQQLRIETDDENTILKRYIVAARQYCEGVVNFHIARKKLRLLYKEFYPDFIIRVCPIISIDSISYYNASNVLTAVASGDYTAQISDAYTAITHDTSWPADLSQTLFNTVQIDVTVGRAQPYEQHKQAILLISAHWHANREDSTDLKLASIPHGAMALLGISNNQVFS